MTRPILTLGLAAAVAALSGADASTTVAVIEIGKGGVARRTTSPSSKTSVSAVASFWNSMHDVDNGEKRRRTKALQYPGMTVVPDLFKRADGGVAIGITGSGVDLASMPTISSMIEEESVGHFRLSGFQGLALMEKTGKANEIVENSAFGSKIDEKVRAAATHDGSNKLGAVSVRVNDDEAAQQVDANIAKTIKSLQKQAAETGSTVVIHLVVDEEEGAARRRLTQRRLEEEDEDEDENEEEGEDEDENEDENEGEDEDENEDENEGEDGGSSSSGNERTIFQIQYFNVVLWTSVGLTATLVLSVGLTVSMPLEPDTLLFGESAKIVGE